MVARRISRTTSLLCTYRLFSLSGIFTSVAFFPSKVPPSATRLCLLGQHTSPNRFCLGQRNSFLQYNFSILILIYIYQLRPSGSSPGCSDASRSETVPKSIFQDISISGRFGVKIRNQNRQNWGFFRLNILVIVTHIVLVVEMVLILWESMLQGIENFDLNL